MNDLLGMIGFQVKGSAQDGISGEDFVPGTVKYAVERFAQSDHNLLNVESGAGRELAVEQHARLSRRQREGGNAIGTAHRASSSGGGVRGVRTHTVCRRIRNDA